MFGFPLDLDLLSVDREARGQMTWRQPDMLAFEAKQLHY